MSEARTERPIREIAAHYAHHLKELGLRLPQNQDDLQQLVEATMYYGTLQVLALIGLGPDAIPTEREEIEKAYRIVRDDLEEYAAEGAAQLIEMVFNKLTEAIEKERKSCEGKTKTETVQ